MSYRRTPLAVGEWFHCYTRTIDHSRPFEEDGNVRRFLETLYLANQSSSMPIMPVLYKKHTHENIFLINKDSPLVSIGAYCIMPTHYHLLVQPVRDNGLSEFLHKVGTGFTRFYNDRHERVGNLFIKPFRSEHVSSDRYFGRIANYIHLNPIDLFEPAWRRGMVKNPHRVRTKLLSYAHSSLIDYEHAYRPQRHILHEESMKTIRIGMSPLAECISDAAEYYRFLALDL